MDKMRKLELLIAQVRVMTDVDMSDSDRADMVAVMHGVIDQSNDDSMRRIAEQRAQEKQG